MTEESEASAKTDKSEVVYVIVVHGMGEQRKNETTIDVVNRFAEARRQTSEDDQREVMTLGTLHHHSSTRCPLGLSSALASYGTRHYAPALQRLCIRTVSIGSSP